MEYILTDKDIYKLLTLANVAQCLHCKFMESDFMKFPCSSCIRFSSDEGNCLRFKWDGVTDEI